MLLYAPLVSGRWNLPRPSFEIHLRWSKRVLEDLRPNPPRRTYSTPSQPLHTNRVPPGGLDGTNISGAAEAPGTPADPGRQAFAVASLHGDLVLVGWSI